MDPDLSENGQTGGNPMKTDAHHKESVLSSVWTNHQKITILINHGIRS